MKKLSWLKQLGPVAFIVILAASCQKKDFTEIIPAQNKEAATSQIKNRFFEHDSLIDQRVLFFMDDIRRQDSIHHFIERLVGKNGYPLWSEYSGNILTETNSNQALTRDAAVSTGTNDTLLVFFPLRRDDTRNINTILACSKVGTKTWYKLLQRQYYDYKLITAKEAEKFDFSALAVFNHFEKKINKLDSVQIGFSRDYYLKNAELRMRNKDGGYNTLDAPKLNTTDYWGLNFDYCITTKPTYVAHARPLNIDVVIVQGEQCGSVSYWTFMGGGEGGSSGSGTTRGTGGSGDGGTGGGSTGSGNGDAGFICPATEWWCESGDFRMVDGQLFTPDYYPFKSKRFPWLWWETAGFQNASLPTVFANTELLELSVTDAQYLIQQNDISQDTYLFMEENEFSIESKFASRTTINQLSQNTIDGPYDGQHLAIVNANVQKIGCCPTGPVLGTTYIAELSRRTAFIKREHPDWSWWKSYREAIFEMVHIGFDILGMVPVGGEVFDVANGVIYLVQGDGKNASLSFLATAPVIGWGATGAKYAAKYIHLADGSRKLLSWYKDINGFIRFGKPNSAQFRKLLGLATGDTRQAHHIIPWELVDQTSQSVIQKAAQARFPFHVQDIMNGIPISALQHSGSHPNYTLRVNQALENIKISYGSNLTPEIAYQEIVNLTNRIKAEIASHPNTKIDDLIF